MIDTSHYTYWTPVVILVTGEEIHGEPIHECDIDLVRDAYVDGIKHDRSDVVDISAQGDLWTINIAHIAALGFEPHH